MFEYIFLLYEFETVGHGLVIDGGEAGNDLHEEVLLWIGTMVVVGYDFEDVSVEVEGVLEVSDLVLQLVVLLAQHLLHIHLI